MDNIPVSNDIINLYRTVVSTQIPLKYLYRLPDGTITNISERISASIGDFSKIVKDNPQWNTLDLAMVYYGIQRTEGTGGTEEIINEINEFYTESGMPTINVIESYNSWYANYRLASKEDVTRFTELLQIFNDIDNIDLKDL